jgi:hypothetical protein
MSQNDLWAANGVACLKAACAATDQKKRAVLIHLGGFWLDLAHAPPAQIDSAMASRIAAMERVQAGLLWNASHLALAGSRVADAIALARR